jgi:hypothetical protein
MIIFGLMLLLGGILVLSYLEKMLVMLTHPKDADSSLPPSFWENLSLKLSGVFENLESAEDWSIALGVGFFVMLLLWFTTSIKPIRPIVLPITIIWGLGLTAMFFYAALTLQSSPHSELDSSPGKQSSAPPARAKSDGRFCLKDPQWGCWQIRSLERREGNIVFSFHAGASVFNEFNKQSGKGVSRRTGSGMSKLEVNFAGSTPDGLFMVYTGRSQDRSIKDKWYPVRLEIKKDIEK